MAEIADARPPDGRPSAGEAGHVAALAALDGVGPVRLRWLLSLGRASEVWSRLASGSPMSEHHRASPVGRDVLRRWSSTVRGSPELPDTMQRRLAALGIEVHTTEAMVERLAEDPDPAPVLFSRGAGLGSDTARVAVVGTRRASAYGLRVARQLGRDLSDAGVQVVSGLALGVDAAAHSGAVQGPSPAVAVVGAGHDRPCPSRNRPLARRLLERGTMLSEVPPGVASAPWRYPVRNRLIAALADVVVVVESASVGGSMSTVAESLLRDRPVMAVPGPLGRRSSEGCHDLLRDGAEICTGAQDVLMLLGLTCGHVGPLRAPPEHPARSEPAARVLELLADGPLTMDAVMERGAFDLAAASAVLAELEGRSLVTRRGGLIERTDDRP